MRARVLLILLAVVAVVGCGPKPGVSSESESPPVTLENTAASPTNLDGVWLVTSIEVPPGSPSIEKGTLEKLVCVVNGNRVVGQVQGVGIRHHLVIQVDESTTPKSITIIRSDESGDIDPIRPPQFSPKVGYEKLHAERQSEARERHVGVFSVNGNVAKLAVSTDPRVRPTNFVAKGPKTQGHESDKLSPEENTVIMVVYFMRVKEVPAWFK
jgi:hypothetical protein